jgi:CelD/BcsL family acetyltransferase involved in cellulose biosynthesis
MKARIVRACELTPRDETAWRRLARDAVEPNPLFEPDCVVAAARHQSFGHQIEVVFAEDGDRIFGCIPVRPVRQWCDFPYPFVTTRVRRMVYCGTPLLDPERSQEAMAAIFEGLARRRGLRHGRILVLQEVAAGGPVDRAIEQAADVSGLPFERYQSWERAFLRRREGESYQSMHSKKHLSHLRRLRRRLNAAAGGEVHLVDRSDDPAAVEEIIRLEASGYKAATGIAMATVAGEPEYFRAMCDAFREDGRLLVYTLEANDTVCAVALFLRGGDGLFLLKIGYDERFAQTSPGVQLHLSVIEHFHEALDAQWIDTCTYAENAALERMYPDQKQLTSYFVALAANPVDRLAMRSFQELQPILSRIGNSVRARRARWRFRLQPVLVEGLPSDEPSPLAADRPSPSDSHNPSELQDAV